jgi:hypothetical protein
MNISHGTTALNKSSKALNYAIRNLKSEYFFLLPDIDMLIFQSRIHVYFTKKELPKKRNLFSSWAICSKKRGTRIAFEEYKIKFILM